MKIELITNRPGLERLFHPWEDLADQVGEPRSAAAIVYAWAQQIQPANEELRVWTATESGRLVGALPFTVERLARGHERFQPPGEGMMVGVLPLAHPASAAEVASALVSEMAQSSPAADIVRTDWLPAGSVWVDAFEQHMAAAGFVHLDVPVYPAPYISTAGGVDGWLSRKTGHFRHELRRRARRAEEEGFVPLVCTEPSEVVERLPALRELYQGRRDVRGGTGYDFDEQMLSTLADAVKRSRQGRFRLVILARGPLAIGALLSVCAGENTTCWLTGFDAAWPQLGPGLGTFFTEVAAAAQAGQVSLDLGVGEEPYKRLVADGERKLRSCVYCRPKLARMLGAGAVRLAATGARSGLS